MPGRSSRSLRSKKRKSPDVTGASTTVEETVSTTTTTTTAPPSKKDGSFVLQVDNGQEQVRIPHDQAKILRANSQFFEHSFCHGTTEASSGVLTKPDWSLGTAQRILKLLAQGSIPVPPSHSALQQVRVAADQILLPFTIPHPVFTIVDLQKKRAILELVQETQKRCSDSFVFRRCDLTDRNHDDFDDEEEDSQDSSGNDSDSDNNSETRLFQKKNGPVDLWLQFLKQGILVTDVDKGFSIQLTKKQSGDTEEEPNDDKRNYRVHYSTPLYLTMTHLCTGLRQIRGFDDASSDNDSMGRDMFRMTFQIYCGFYNHCLDLTEDLDVCWEGDFNVDGIADDVTVATGAVEDLSALLVHLQDFIVPCKNVQKIALFFHNPEWQVLGRLIHATQQCQDNPNTLLWDSEGNDFFTMKTLLDTKTILGLLSRDSSPVAKNGTFELTEKCGMVVSRLGNNWVTR